MSRRTRRSLSWAALAAGLAVLGLAAARLPGSGGLAAELRWQLARAPGPTPTARSMHLLREAEQRGPGASGRVLADLLAADDARIVDAALRLAADLAWQDDLADAALADWWPALGRWLNAAGPPARQAHVAGLARCLAAWFSRDDDPRPPKMRDNLEVARPRPPPPGLRLGPGDLRLLLAASLAPGRDITLHVLDTLLRDESEATRHIVLIRLRLLDDPAFDTSFGGAAPAPWQAEIARENVADWRPLVLRCQDWLVAALDDPEAHVRWAAGRVLAVCRDARGLPAVRDWLRRDPRAPRGPGILETLFGPDWRDPDAGGGAAREPRAGDGGG